MRVDITTGEDENFKWKVPQPKTLSDYIINVDPEVIPEVEKVLVQEEEPVVEVQETPPVTPMTNKGGHSWFDGTSWGTK